MHNVRYNGNGGTGTFDSYAAHPEYRRDDPRGSAARRREEHRSQAVWSSWVPLVEQATRLEFAGGVTVSVGPQLGIYAQAGYQFAVSPTDTGRFKGNIGLRYTWWGGNGSSGRPFGWAEFAETINAYARVTPLRKKLSMWSCYRFGADEYAASETAARAMLERYSEYLPAYYVLIAAAAMQQKLHATAMALADALRLQPDLFAGLFSSIRRFTPSVPEVRRPILQN